MTLMTVGKALWQGGPDLWLNTLRTWPWFDTLRTLRARFREDRLGITASSLTFTTLVALVPLVTVMLALFSAFPMFAKFQGALQQYFLQSLVPDSIAKPVLAALTQFAGKANRLGSGGLVVLVVTALSLMLTIDRTLNSIWRVPKPRPIAQRVLVYWAALTLGPLLLGISLSLTSYALTASRGLVNALPGGLSLLLDTLEFGLLAAAMAGLFHYVPNTFVRWRHAWAGALFVAVGFELAKKGLGWYLAAVPGFAAIYGVFATVPILLLWIYLSWVIVLLGAVVAAYAPSLQRRVVRQAEGPGRRLGLALQMLRALQRARLGEPQGLALGALSEQLRVDPLQVEPLLDLLLSQRLVARLDEAGDPRWVLLCEPEHTRAEPLLDALLLQPDATTAALRRHAGVQRLTLAELLEDA